MFLKCSEIKSDKGKIYKNYKIVESVRKKDKVKHKILYPLGTLSDQKAEQIRKVLAVVSSPNDILIRLEDVIVEENINFLDIYIFRLLWKEWGLDKLFEKCPCIERLVINRCLSPRNKIGAMEWNRGCILDYIGEAKVQDNKFGVYTDLDRIAKMEEATQRHIGDKIRELGYDSLDAVIYDITSTYFEETNCIIAFRGYSRDHRPDKLQIVIALAITPKGYPFYWKVYKGNTQDITTVESFVDDVKKTFGIEKCLLVFDRGMVSSDNIEYIEGAGYEYITAIDKDEIEGLGINDLPAFGEIDENNISKILNGYQQYDGCLQYKEHIIGEKRYILGFDLGRKMEERTCRQEKIEKFKQSIKNINEDLITACRSRDLQKVQAKVNYLVKRYKFSRIVHTNYEEITLERGKKDIKSYRMDISFNENELKKAGRLDGVTCFYTNTANDRVSAEGVIRQYRQKNRVEESFHEMKSHIKVRPVFVSRSVRVRAHVTICVLACLLLNTLEERIAGMSDVSGMDGILDELGKCKINVLTIKDNTMTHAVITKMTELQKSILRTLGYESICTSKEIKNVLKKLKKM